jgi:hypothetical protein
MLAQFRAEAARERDELRTDLRARAERAEHDADTYGAELAHPHDGTGQDDDARPSRRSGSRSGHILKRKVGHAATPTPGRLPASGRSRSTHLNAETEQGHCDRTGTGTR